MSARWTLTPDQGREWPGLDPYSHWLLSHGADFMPSNGEHTDRPPIMGVINKDNLASFTKGGAFLTDLVNGPVGSLDNPLLDYDEFLKIDKRAPSQRMQRETTQLIFRLPMRAESQPEKALRNGQRIDPDNWALRFDPTGKNPVIVIVIDDVMNVSDSRYCGSDGKTRIEFAWNQDGIARNNSKVPFGREISGNEIDALRHKYGNKQDRILTELGLRSFEQVLRAPLDRRYSHGSHMLDIAGGKDDAQSGKDDALRLIGVMLPQACTRESSGALSGFYVLTGLQYALKRARIIQREIGGPVPVIVNFSYGITGGPHDGTHFIENFIQTAIDKEVDGNMPVTLVMPAGNTRLDRGHAVARADENGSCTLSLPWRIQPGDSTPNYLEIWIPADAVWSALDITMPDGTALTHAKFPARRAFLIRNGQDQVIARISLDQPTGRRGKQRLLFAMIPTSTTIYSGKRRVAQSGIWQVNVTADLQAGTRIEAWIQRDVWPLRVNAETRQSYFDDPDYARLSASGRAILTDPVPNPSGIQRAGTLNGWATGRGTSAPVVVGAVNGRGTQDADYTALSDRDMINGDENATPVPIMAERGDMARGMLGAGSRAGSVVALGGTSVAAPQITRMLADAVCEGTLDANADMQTWLQEKLAQHQNTLPAKWRHARK